MSDFLSVTCSCGCDNRVPAEHRGRSALCIACGNELPIGADVVAQPAARTPMLESPAAPVAPMRRAHSPFEEEPIAAAAEHRFTTYASPVHERIGEYCTQCDRELRGAWDLLETHKGVLCYACANLATAGVPERLKQMVNADADQGRGRPRSAARPCTRCRRGGRSIEPLRSRP